MPVCTPMVMEIDKKTWLVQEYGLDCCYLLLGERSGLVIDTGCGRMSIARLARRLFAGRPYEVVLTHGHGHHAGGAAQFAEVYCAEVLEKPILEEAVSPDFAPTDFEMLKIPMEGKPLHTGDVFELGGREVLCIRTPGHSPGSCSFYDANTGIAFTGDAVAAKLRVNCVSDALAGLMELKRMAPDLNRIYPGHVAYTDHRALPAAALDDAIGACRAALAPDGHHYHTGENRVVFRSVTLEYQAKWAPSEPCSPYPIGL